MKKLMLIALIFSLMGFSASLAAKEGAKLRIQKKDGHNIEGELIGIKDHTLMLIDGSGVYISCAIDEAHMITIGKKSKFLTGAVPGFLLGAIGGAVIGSHVSEPEPPKDLGTAFVYAITGEPELHKVAGGVVGGVLGGVVGLTIGGIISVSAGGPPEKILIEGKSQEEIRICLEKLRSKARFPDYQ
jgi:hypothetical protein